MGIKNERGFTIIELSLFFAVSGLLLVTLLTGIGVSIQNQRFSDAVNGLQSFLQQQYNETQITINDRQASDCGTNARGSSDCLIVGKLIDLGKSDENAQDTTIHSYVVIVDQKAADAALQARTPPTELHFLNNQTTDPDKANTKAIKSSQSDQDYTVPWGAKLTNLEDTAGHSSPAGGSAGVRYVLVIRSPISGIISTYKLDFATDFEAFDTSNEASLATHIKEFDGSDQSIKGCVTSADFSGTKALLKLTPGSTQDSVTTQFDTPEKVSWCG